MLVWPERNSANCDRIMNGTSSCGGEADAHTLTTVVRAIHQRPGTRRLGPNGARTTG
jgi:hypothetical protein